MSPHDENAHNDTPAIPSWFLATDEDDAAFLKGVLSSTKQSEAEPDTKQTVQEQQPDAGEDWVRKALDDFCEQVIIWDTPIGIFPAPVANSFHRASAATCGEALSISPERIPQHGDLRKRILDGCLAKCAAYTTPYPSLPDPVIHMVQPLCRYEGFIWGPLGNLHVMAPKDTSLACPALVELDQIFKRAADTRSGQDGNRESQPLGSSETLRATTAIISGQPASSDDHFSDVPPKSVPGDFDAMPIKALAVSEAIARRLVHAGYATVGELNRASDGELLAIRGFGALGLQKVREAITAVHAEDEKLNPDSGGRMLGKQLSSLTAPNGTGPGRTNRASSDFDAPLSALDLKDPLVRALRGGGFSTVGELNRASDDQLLSIRNFGVAKLRAVREALESFSRSQKADEKSSEQAEQLADQAHQLLQDGGIKAPLTPFKAWALPIAQALVDTGALDAASLADLLKRLDDAPTTTQAPIPLSAWLDRLEASGERANLILLQRLSGSTLAETGEAFGLTRERIRQVVDTRLSRRPLIEEDRFVPLVQRYAVAQDEFCAIFDAAPMTFNYVKLVAKTTSKSICPLDEALMDTELDLDVRKRIRAHLDGQRVAIGPYRVKRRKQDIIEAVVRVEAAAEPRAEGELYAAYEDALRAHHLTDESFEFPSTRALGAYLARQDYVIRSRKGYRLFDVSYDHLVSLLETIDFHRYWNQEISAALIMRDYPELMRHLDICDSYELHSCLRTLRDRWDAVELADCAFHRAPIMSIGPEASRDAQVIGLINEMAPVDIKALAAEYEHRYGVDALSFTANAKKSYAGFMQGNTFLSIRNVALTSRDAAFVERSLQLGARSMQAVRERFDRTMSDRDERRRFHAALNPHSLREAGFAIEGNCLFKSDEDPEQVIGLLLSRDEFAEEDFDRGLWTSSLFQQTLSKTLRSFILLSMGDGTYRSARGLGIKPDDCRSYIDAAIEKALPGEPFNTHLLRDDGFEHSLMDSCPSDRMLDELLVRDNRLRRTSVEFTRIFASQVDSLSLVDIIEWLMHGESELTINHINELLWEHFGAQAKLANLRTAAKKAGRYSADTDSVSPWPGDAV